MHRVLIVGLALCLSGPALAQNTGSGQQTGGPARDRISATGGRQKPVATPDPRRLGSGSHAGGTLNNRRPSTGPREASPVVKRSRSVSRYGSGSRAGGPLPR
ncbi:hypothetical protein ME121_6558 [Methylobacterium sp. ME121]|nr:hypothetical protein [Methylobacterium sp.]OXE38174.1 hypothetical protein CCS92_30780 [Methylobacterium radiotolerans]RUP12625.1 MAG: hypothetical protein EKK43_20845 [Methylobacterium sp.]RUP20002.1 MAG: hypothetical protein EKK44_16500 [Methylobacterium sp.]GAN52418.1 hypothetical protein ME121_6558 [Methylobacterium sp. ME121]